MHKHNQQRRPIKYLIYIEIENSISNMRAPPYNTPKLFFAIAIFHKIKTKFEKIYVEQTRGNNGDKLDLTRQLILKSTKYANVFKRF